VLAYLGLGAVSFGGFLGGHLSYRQAAGVNHTEDVPHRFPSGWQPLAPLEDLPDGKLHQRVVAGLPLLVFREGETVNVLSDVCSHLSGPLHEGKLKGGSVTGGSARGGGEPCVVCPWHGSTFSLRSGEVQAGPATSRQPRFETRVTGGLVEVNLPGAD
jgi:nitrite reductase/ring-hydroxylating ferredoxin subunit